MGAFPGGQEHLSGTGVPEVDCTTSLGMVLAGNPLHTWYDRVARLTDEVTCMRNSIVRSTCCRVRNQTEKTDPSRNF